MFRSVLALCGLVAVGGLLSTSDTTPPVVGNRVPVVVELFTSEGCSSCPAADDALRQLETAQSVAGVEVLALGEHVDYWNRLGWKDPFSAAAFTERQRQYAAAFNTNSYTPQAVVNGRTELVGSRQSALGTAIEQAAKAPRAAEELTCAGAALHVRVGQLPAGTGASTVLLAFTETGLSSQVGRGENSGRLLRHAAVVRELRPLGSIKPDGTFAATPPLALDPKWKAANLKAVVLVQENASRHIVGVGSLPLRTPLAAVN
ncbi:DUF1223 domain-containing protein [Hymenobacter wooponensis]|uniref:DUF1223 domain-containing protein n=1 Tax=Hymenobacter wooponensis TaxID=1525360 RepID=A0A4Z0MTU3_9BACT|nr:DUF1223 domain-containing protein [Hymenobacter wooponensis]TGD83101.1 DUF1223 domain-containing protein [Hymenobacter wooponensis]